MNKTWLNFSLITSEEEAFYVSECLSMAGALSVSFEPEQVENPLFEPDPDQTPLWQKTKVIGCFEGANKQKEEILIEREATSQKEKIINFLEAYLSPEILKTASTDIIEDQDWERLSLENLLPMQFGKNLWICPSWQEIPDRKENKNAITVLLDPGLAFGTGMHPTTRMCLEWLESQFPIQGQGLDYGCGSGILSIAAIKLGADSVTAVDHDPQALTSTEENARRNAISKEKLKICLPQDLNLKTHNIQIDFLVSNILALPLIELAKSFAEMIKPGGKFMISGILETQEKEVTQAYSSFFEGFRIAHLGEWVAISGTRKK